MVKIPFPVYFARKSSSWENKGVAFLDYEAKGSSIGRAWLVTAEQFDEIYNQEGPGWYDKVLALGSIEGITAITFTSGKRLEDNSPSDKYKDVISKGREETEQLEYRNFD